MVHLGSKQGPIEAKSLSSITTLASNPPKYPRNPTQQPLEPLVLYIVRVPGSRDVFLTPLKPATKSSISAEAIKSSLYYLHVSTEEDEAIRQTIEEERQAERQYAEENPTSQAGDLARLNNVRRKPVPGGGGVSAAQTENTPPPPLPQRPPLQVGQDGMGPGVSQGNMAGSPHRPRSGGNHTDGAGDFTEPRKPLVPRRPLPQLPNDSDQGLSPVSHVNRDPSPRRWSAAPVSPATPVPSGLRAEQLDTSTGRFSLDSRRPEILSGTNSPREGGRTPTNFLQRPSQPATSRRSFDGPRDNGIPRFHVTLIRRDPSYGSQWNVGTISNQESASLGDDSSIDLEISTPAYKNFARQDEPLSLAELGINLPSAMQNRSNSSLPVPQIPSEPSSRKSSAAPVPLKFTRRVSLLPAYRSHHRFSSSNDSNDPTSARDQSPIKSPTAKTKGVYTFTSLWNGTCAFSMSVNGRSLKCKHTIAEPSSNFTTGGQSASPTMTAAELRFNLPAFPSTNTAANRGRHRADKPRQYHQFQQQEQQPRPPFARNNNDRPGSSGSEAGDKRISISNFFHPPPKHQDRSQSHSPSRFRAHFQNHHHNNNNQHPRPPPQPPRPQISALNTNLPNHQSHNSNNNATPDPFTSPDHDPDRLDLGLARERAGGGLRGKSAKLGKLIINDEGQKMLDLVVAACMGVWWKYYE
ncbi:hypothetical protein FQN54_000523 [Arachnomyces sp. PD_36]|nr:hypothetical protein FQN54_000523 [Arachnomyces sp. PD_36]